MAIRDQIPLTDSVVWTISAKWSSHPYACTLQGVKTICGGRCCSTRMYWPPNAFGNRGKTTRGPLSVEVANGDGLVVPAYACKHLTPHGCGFDRADMPITCQIHPFILNQNNCLVCPNWVTMKKGVCKGAFNSGESTLIESLADSLSALFGRDQYEDAKHAILEEHKDALVIVPKHVHLAYLCELDMCRKKAPPIPLRDLYNRIMGNRR